MYSKNTENIYKMCCYLCNIHIDIIFRNINSKNTLYVELHTDPIQTVGKHSASIQCCHIHRLTIQEGCSPSKLRQNHHFSGKSPPKSGKTIIFGQKLNFSGRSQQPKMKIFCVYLLNEKTEFILSSEIKCPKSGIFTNNYWVWWVGQSNFAS